MSKAHLFILLIVVHQMSMQLITLPKPDPMITILSSKDLAVITGNTFYTYNYKAVEKSKTILSEIIPYASIYRLGKIIILIFPTGEINKTKILLLSSVDYKIIKQETFSSFNRPMSVALYDNFAYVFITSFNSKESPVYIITEKNMEKIGMITYKDADNETICSVIPPNVFCVYYVGPVPKKKVASLFDPKKSFKPIIDNKVYGKFELATKYHAKIKPFATNQNILCDYYVDSLLINILCLLVIINESLTDMVFITIFENKTLTPHFLDLITVGNKIILGYGSSTKKEINFLLYEYNGSSFTQKLMNSWDSSELSINHLTLLMMDNGKMIIAVDNGTKSLIQYETFSFATCQHIYYKIKTSSTLSFIFTQWDDSTMKEVIMIKEVKDINSAGDLLGELLYNDNKVAPNTNTKYEFGQTFKFVTKEVIGTALISFIVEKDIEGAFIGGTECFGMVEVVQPEELKCWNTCGTCTVGGNTYDHQCTTCAEGYNKYKDETSTQCYDRASADVNWILIGSFYVECRNMMNGKCLDLGNGDSKISNTLLPKDELIDLLDNDIGLFANESMIFKGKDYVIQIYDKKNEGNNKDNGKEYKLTTADLDACLKELAKHYGIGTEDIIIMKIDINCTDSPTNMVEFSYYAKNKTKLEAKDICRNAEIKITFPIVNTTDLNIEQAKNMQSQGFDAFDPNSEVFNDICTPFTTESGVDVSMSTRREDLYQNVTMCQADCTYNGTNLTDMTASCICKGVGDITLNKLVNDFVQEIFTNNFFVVTCYRLLLNGKELLSNIGFIIVGSFIILNTFFILYILIRGFTQYILVLNKSPNPNPPNGKTNNPTMKLSFKDSIPINLNQNPGRPFQENQDQDIIIENIDNNNDYNGIEQQQSPHEVLATRSNDQSPNKHDIINDKSYNKIDPNSPSRNRPCSNNNLLQLNSNKKFLNGSSENIIELNKCIKKTDEDFSYIGELLFQYREDIAQSFTFCGIYWNTLKDKHSIWVTFCSYDYLELKVLQVMIFFNSIAIDFSLNALFYSNSYIDQRYADNGALDFFFSLPKSIFSFLLGIVINFVLIVSTSPTTRLKKFVNENIKKIENKQVDEIHMIDKVKKENEDNKDDGLSKSVKEEVINIKIKRKTTKRKSSSRKEINFNEKDNENDNDKSPCESPVNLHYYQTPEYIVSCQKIVKETKCRLSIFLVINYVIMILFLYYVSCFCAVNKNSQIDWLIGCIISFGIAMAIPFAMSLIITFIKWISLKCKCQTLYVFNEAISNIL